MGALKQQIGEPPGNEDSALKTVIDSGMTGNDAGDLRGASRKARFAMFSSVARVRSNVAFEINQLAESTESSAESRRARWEQLCDKYRKQSEVYQAFRWQSAGSLYR